MQFKVGSPTRSQALHDTAARAAEPVTIASPPASVEAPRRFAVPTSLLEGRQKGPVALETVETVPPEPPAPDILEARPVAEPLSFHGAALEAEINRLAQAPDARRFGEKVYERARQVLEEAYESAAELRLEALARVREQMTANEKAGADVRSRANDEAQAMRSQAATEAQLALQRAQREADAIVANARSTARRIAEGAQAEADAIQKRAQREAQEVHDAAARALADARLRIEEIERIEASFEANAREIARWLGLTVEPERSVFAGIRRKK